MPTDPYRELTPSPQTERPCKVPTAQEVAQMLDDHELWLASKGEKGRIADFSLMVLDCIKIVGRDLSHAIFDRASLEAVAFENTKCNGTNFEDACLSHAHMDFCSLQSACFTGANLTHLRALKSDFSEAVFRSSWGSFLLFDRCQMREASVSGAIWDSSIFSQCDMQDMGAEQCDFFKCSFPKSRLDGSSFNLANLQDTDFREASLKHTRLRGANLHGAYLVDADLSNWGIDRHTIGVHPAPHGSILGWVRTSTVAAVPVRIEEDTPRTMSTTRVVHARKVTVLPFEPGEAHDEWSGNTFRSGEVVESVGWSDAERFRWARSSGHYYFHGPTYKEPYGIPVFLTREEAEENTRLYP